MRAIKHPSKGRQPIDLKGTYTIRFADGDPTRQELIRYVKEMSDQVPPFARLNLSEVIRSLIRAALGLYEQGLLDQALEGSKFTITSAPDADPDS